MLPYPLCVSNFSHFKSLADVSSPKSLCDYEWSWLSAYASDSPASDFNSTLAGNWNIGMFIYHSNFDVRWLDYDYDFNWSEATMQLLRLNRLDVIYSRPSYNWDYLRLALSLNVDILKSSSNPNLEAELEKRLHQVARTREHTVMLEAVWQRIGQTSEPMEV